MFIFAVIYLYDKKIDHWLMTIADIRRENARALASLAGTRTAFGEKVGMENSQVSQIIGKNPTKDIGNSIARRIEKAFDKQVGWMDVEHASSASDKESASHTPLTGMGISQVRAVYEEEKNPNIARIRKVKLHLSAGIVGFTTDQEEEDGNPIYFRNDWLAARGYKPENLIAIRVKGESMEPNLHAGDTVVINTADTTPKDGDVFAVNYEGEDVVKRLMRDAGTWWLSSDNNDQRRYQKKECNGDMCLLIGKVIHKQSERI